LIAHSYGCVEHDRCDRQDCNYNLVVTLDTERERLIDNETMMDINKDVH